MSSTSSTREQKPTTKARVHACTHPGCTLSFTKRSDMTRHVNDKHLDTVQFVCCSCPHDSRQRPHMENHWRTKHAGEEGKIYSCLCGERFADTTPRGRHIKSSVARGDLGCGVGPTSRYYFVEGREYRKLGQRVQRWETVQQVGTGPATITPSPRQSAQDVGMPETTPAEYDGFALPLEHRDMAEGEHGQYFDLREAVRNRAIVGIEEAARAAENFGAGFAGQAQDVNEVQADNMGPAPHGPMSGTKEAAQSAGDLASASAGQGQNAGEVQANVAAPADGNLYWGIQAAVETEALDGSSKGKPYKPREVPAKNVEPVQNGSFRSIEGGAVSSSGDLNITLTAPSEDTSGFFGDTSEELDSFTFDESPPPWDASLLPSSAQLGEFFDYGFDADGILSEGGFAFDSMVDQSMIT